MLIKREECPHCGRIVSRKTNGQFYAHMQIPGSLERYAGNRCPMSNVSPSVELWSEQDDGSLLVTAHTIVPR